MDGSLSLDDTGDLVSQTLYSVAVEQQISRAWLSIAPVGLAGAVAPSGSRARLRPRSGRRRRAFARTGRRTGTHWGVTARRRSGPINLPLSGR